MAIEHTLDPDTENSNVAHPQTREDPLKKRKITWARITFQRTVYFGRNS